jgi:hypothetical protein
MTKPRNDVSVKIDAAVYRLARTAASWKGMSVAEYLSEVVRPIASRDVAKIDKEARKSSGSASAEEAE